MKTLFLIRHATAENRHGIDDYARKLTQRGVDEAELMADKLYETGARPDAIVSSSANRALETARIFAERFVFPESKIVKDRMIYEASLNRLLNLVTGLEDDCHSVFLFGHNPGITNAVNYLCGDILNNMPKCGIAEIRFETDDWSAISSETGRAQSIDYPKRYT